MTDSVEKEYKIEKYVIIGLWTGALVSYSLALMFNYKLFLSDIIGIIGLSLVTVVYFVFRRATFYLLFFLLFIGMLNLASFIYFVNIGITYGFLGKSLDVGIQLYSTIYMAIFITARRPKIIRIYQVIFRETEKHKLEEHDLNRTYFFKKFQKLSDVEIERKLSSNGLSQAAIDALVEIQVKRRMEREN